MSMTDEEILSSTLSKREKVALLIQNNRGLLRKEAARFKNSTPVCDEEDYEQEACLALMGGLLDTYDASRGNKFTTYLTTCIKNAIKSHAGQFYGPLTVTSGARGLIYRVNLLRNKGLSDEEICSALKIRPSVVKNVSFLLKLSRIEEGIDERVMDIPTRLIVDEARLSAVEKEIIEMRQSKTLREVADLVGRSYEWVRQVELGALDKVKKVI